MDRPGHLFAAAAGLAICLVFAAAVAFGLYTVLHRWADAPQPMPAVPPCALKAGDVAHITAWVEGNQVVARCEIYRGKS